MSPVAVPVQQLAEHPQSATCPANRHPGVVDRVTAPAEAEVAVEHGVDLFGDVTHERLTRCGANGRLATRRLVYPGQFGWIAGGFGARRRQAFRNPPSERRRVFTDLDLDLAPRQQAMVDRRADMVVGHLGAEPIAARVGDLIPVAGCADRRDIHQRFAKAHAR